MAARKVQSYLDQHRIGPLFEDLMSKLIKDMPTQPIPYLIKSLRKLSPEEEVKGTHGRPPSGSRSMSPGFSKGLSGTPITRHSYDDSNHRRSALAKSWAAPDTHPDSDPYKDHTKQRDYDRPWLTGSRPMKTTSENTRPGILVSSEVDGSKTRKSMDSSSWNPDTRVPTHDFDELFEYNSSPAKDSYKTALYDGPRTWNDNDMDASLDKRGLGYPLHIKRSSQPIVMATDDGLEGEELKLRSDLRTIGDSSDSGVSVSSYGSGRSYKSIDARRAAEEHRRQLQALLLNTSSGTQGASSFGKRKDDSSDDGTEILENLGDLESEGVDNFALLSGAKLTKSSRTGSSTSDSVKVSICARCARVITGTSEDQQSDVGSTLSTNNYDFNSVSQAGSISGDPPRITWPSGFDSEGEPTPRKGRHMWQSTSSKPEKGQHMYRSSAFPSDLRSSPIPRPSSSASERSDNGLFSKPAASRKWKKYDDFSSDTEGADTYRASSPEVGSSRPWTRPPPDSASDAGSDTLVKAPIDRKKVAFKSKGFRRYQGNLSDSDS